MHALPRFVLLVLLAGLLGACETGPPYPAETLAEDPLAPGTGPTLHLNDAPDEAGYGTLDVLGLAAPALARLHNATLPRQDWEALFALYTADALPTSPDDTPPVLGTYTVQDGGIRFTPRFPLVAGLSYTARFDLRRFIETYGAAGTDNAPEALVTTFVLPKETTAPSTLVTHLYPTTDVLPMNQLKMYIHFSAPMRLGEAYDRIRLLDAGTGEAVADPFVILDQELWDATRQRFTLLFDPGRIKRDLRPHLEAGLPLQEGNRYRLVVEAGWPDAAGNPLAQPFEKAFAVTAPDRTSPDYASWVLTPPTAGSTAPVTLAFGEPLDHALLQRLLVVRTASGEEFDGRVAVEQAETLWTFTPSEAWTAGAYVIEVEAILEDLAGNNLRHVFDVDLNEQTPDRNAEHVPIRLPFNVAPL
jgi:hypothetical protein